VNGENIPAKRHRLEHVEIFEVTGDELDNIERETANIGTDLQFCLVLLPVAISMTVSLVLTTIASQRIYNSFFIVMAVAYLGGLFFGVRWLSRRGSYKRIFQKIRDRRVGPIGQEGKELNAAELAELPSSEPPLPAQGDAH
jgi:hypothetical protein